MPPGPNLARSPQESAGAPAATAGVPVVEAEGLGKRYGARWALAHVDVRLAPGRSLLLLGANGSGKTTLLKLLSTAVTPTLGHLRLFGLDVRREREVARRRLALLSHGAYHYEALTARENLRFACDLAAVADARRVVGEALARVGLGSRGDDPVRTFSAGMRKRLALARLLVQTPELAMIDEPYGALDQSGFALVDALVADLRAAGRAVIVSTHLAERGALLCDDAMVLAGGRVHWRGPAREAPGVFQALGAFE